MNTNTKFHVIWAKRLKFVKILSSLELNVGSSDRGRNQLGLGLGLDPSVISRLFCVGRSPELVISRPFGALPSGCWWPTDTVLVIYRLRWWSTDFCWWVPVSWWPPDVLVISRFFLGDVLTFGDFPTFSTFAYFIGVRSSQLWVNWLKLSQNVK